MLAALAAGGAVMLTGGFAAALTDPAGENRLVPPASASVAPTVAAAGIRSANRPAAAIASPPPPSTVAAVARRGGWQVQVGAFRSRQAAEAHVAALGSRVPELSALAAEFQPARALTRVRIGGIASREDARRLCGSVRSHGSGCFPVSPG